MDQPWTSPYQPTRPLIPGDPALSPQELESLRDQLVILTRQIGHHPYDLASWLERTETLSKLQYPELAVGDAWKASLLAGKLMERCSGWGEGREGRGTGGRWRLGYRMGFWMAEQEASQDDRCHDSNDLDQTGRIWSDDPDEHEDTDHDDILWQRLSDLQQAARQIQNENLHYYPQSEEGLFLSRPYPWMAPRHRHRSDKLLKTINAEFAQQAQAQGRETTDCIVRRHAFSRSSPEHESTSAAMASRPTSDILGVFAARDIPAHTTLILDRTRTWGCIGPGTGSYPANLANLHGGQGYADPMHPNFPEETAEQDLRWIRDECGREAAGVLLLCRLLGATFDSAPDSSSEEDIGEDVKEEEWGRKGKHPLDHPLLARLTPSYHHTKPHLFSLHHDIVIPNLFLLRHHHLDIFARPEYDTWLLFELSARSRNNSWSNPLHSCLSSLFSLFNHACEPNVVWEVEWRDSTTMTVSTAREVRVGEQLFVLYDGFMADEAVGVRRRRMRRWLDEDCFCARCVREAAAGEGAGGMAEVRGEVAKGGRGKVDSPMSSRRASPVLVSVAGTGVVREAATWDTAPRVVFPEDRETVRRPRSAGSSC